MELSNFDLPPAIGLEQHDVLTACNLAVDISHSALICLICKYAISPVSKRLLSHVKQHAHCQQTAQLTSCLRYIPLRKPDDIIPKIHGSSSDDRLILHRGIQCSLCEHISARERSHKDHAKQQHGNCCLGSPVEYQTWGYLLLATGRWRVSMPADTRVDNSTTRLPLAPVSPNWETTALSSLGCPSDNILATSTTDLIQNSLADHEHIDNDLVAPKAAATSVSIDTHTATQEVVGSPDLILTPQAKSMEVCWDRPDIEPAASPILHETADSNSDGNSSEGSPDLAEKRRVGSAEETTMWEPTEHNKESLCALQVTPFLHYHSEMQVYICSICHKGMPGSGVLDHVQRSHQHKDKTQPNIVTQVRFKFASIGIDATYMTSPRWPSGPIHRIQHLPVLRDGCACRHCSFVASNSRQIRRHLSRIHPQFVHMKQGRPFKGLLKAHQALHYISGCTYQRLSPKGAYSRQFLIKDDGLNGNVHNSQALPSTPDPNNNSDGLESSLQTESTRQKTRHTQATELKDQESIYMSPWLKRLVYPTLHLDDLTLLIDMRAKPSAWGSHSLHCKQFLDEDKVFVIESPAEIEECLIRIDKCLDTLLLDCAHNVESKNLVIWMLLGMRCTEAGTRRRPFAIPAKAGTLRRYHQLWFRFICFSIRLNLLLTVMPGYPRIMALRQGQISQIENLCRAFQEPAAIEKQTTALLNFSIYFAMENYGSSVATSSLLVYFAGSLAIRPGLTWSLARDYSPHLSCLIYVCRIVLLRHMFSPGPEPTVEEGKRLMDEFYSFRRSNMCSTNPTPLGWLLSERTFAWCCAATEAAPVSFYWTSQHQTLCWEGNSCTLEQYKLISQWSIWRVAEALSDLMFGYSPEVNLSALTDVMTERSIGYSFVAGSNLEEEWYNVARLAKRDIPLKRTADDYIALHQNMLQALALMLHLTCGQSPRGTELLSMKIENTTDSNRELYFHQGLAVCAIQHLKSRHTSNGELYVARFLPNAASELLYKYIVYVRPFVIYLRNKQWSTLADSALLFPHFKNNTKPMETKVVTKELEIVTKNITTGGWGIARHRQISVAIARRHFPELIAKFDRELGATDGQRTMANLSGHSIRSRQLQYGIDSDFHGRLQMDLLAQYHDMCKNIHKWLEIDKMSCNGGTGRESKEICKQLRYGGALSKLEVLPKKGQTFAVVLEPALPLAHTSPENDVSSEEELQSQLASEDEEVLDSEAESLDPNDHSQMQDLNGSPNAVISEMHSKPDLESPMVSEEEEDGGYYSEDGAFGDAYNTKWPKDNEGKEEDDQDNGELRDFGDPHGKRLQGYHLRCLATRPREESPDSEHSNGQDAQPISKRLRIAKVMQGSSRKAR